MKIKYIITSLFLTGLISIYAGDLEEMYKPEIKKVKASEFTTKYGPFKWGGANKRVAMSRTSQLFDYKVREGIAYFDADGEFQRLDSWIYNRGNDGEMSQEKFEAFYEKLLTELEAYFKVKPKKSGISGATRSTAYTFTLSYGNDVSLLVGFEKRPVYRADFLCLVMRNYDQRRARGTAASLKYLTKQDNGDVMVDKIPMIDQGPLGYCVPATLARIGQHYGVDISMHEIAMIADSGNRGTSSRLAMAELKKKYARVKLKIKDIKIDFPGASYISGNQWVDITKSEAQARVEKLSDDDREYKKFVKEVKKRIDKGYMIAWTMVVGLLPENGRPAPQDSGGHMRMIIGYNEKTDELIFSDSWGPGHEVKRLPMKSAFIVSSEIYEIIP